LRLSLLKFPSFGPHPVCLLQYHHLHLYKTDSLPPVHFIPHLVTCTFGSAVLKKWSFRDAPLLSLLDPTPQAPGSRPSPSPLPPGMLHIKFSYILLKYSCGVVLKRYTLISPIGPTPLALGNQHLHLYKIDFPSPRDASHQIKLHSVEPFLRSSL